MNTLCCVAATLLLSVSAPPLLASEASPAAPTIYASSIHAGCYIVAPNQCRIHVEPFTINLTVGKKLVYFKLVAGPSLGVLYDFRPDLSNPPPSSGSTYTPSLVTQDFAATCGSSYYVNLQGQDTGDPTGYSLGTTRTFTCPSVVP